MGTAGSNALYGKIIVHIFTKVNSKYVYFATLIKKRRTVIAWIILINSEHCAKITI